jgi:GNAT superfamily N-acetyltransferase
MTTAGALLIREAALADLPTIVEFNLLLAWESEHRTLDPVILRRGVERALSRPDLCRYFVAERAGQIVGQAMITLELTDWRDGVLWWLQSVYVRAANRSQGVFSAIFHHIRSQAQADRDVRGLRLYVERENRAAQAVYERLGFSPSGHLVYEMDWSPLGSPG